MNCVFILEKQINILHNYVGILLSIYNTAFDFSNYNVTWQYMKTYLLLMKYVSISILLISKQFKDNFQFGMFKFYPTYIT